MESCVLGTTNAGKLRSRGVRTGPVRSTSVHVYIRRKEEVDLALRGMLNDGHINFRRSIQARVKCLPMTPDEWTCRVVNEVARLTAARTTRLGSAELARA